MLLSDLMLLADTYLYCMDFFKGGASGRSPLLTPGRGKLPEASEDLPGVLPTPDLWGGTLGTGRRGHL